MNKTLFVTILSLCVAISAAVTISRGSATATTAATAATAATENWPQWRGPHLNGTSGETDLPTTWSMASNIVWTLELSAWTGATPIIWDDTIFLNVSYVTQAAGRSRRGRGAPAAAPAATADLNSL